MTVAIEEVEIGTLRPHPRNYREHPDDQLEQLASSIRQHGLYRNIVVARDGTILAGHGVVQAALRVGVEKVRVARLDLDPDSPQALKVLAGDNETARLAAIDDRALSELLKEVKDLSEFGLEGTGFDDLMLANLVMVTRPQSEIQDMDEAAEWLGLPDYEPQGKEFRYTLLFRTAEDRAEFARRAELKLGKDERRNWSMWWPYQPKEDIASVFLTDESGVVPAP